MGGHVGPARYALTRLLSRDAWRFDVGGADPDARVGADPIRGVGLSTARAARLDPGGPGAAALHQLASELEAPDIRDLLARFDPEGTADRSWRAFRRATRGAPDLAKAAQRRALAGLLRSWGCRHLRRADDAMTTRALATWWRSARAMMPPADRGIVQLDGVDLRNAALAYERLAMRPAARRAMPAHEHVVTFGSTAAAKAMFMVRPLAFPPWDAAIATAFGPRSAAGAGYAAYVEASADALRALSSRLGIAVDDLPAALGRRDSTPAKIVDEFLWLRLTRGRERR